MEYTYTLNIYVYCPHTFNIIVNTSIDNNIVNIMEWLLECRKIVNIFVNTSILDAHTFNIIVNPTDIDNINERVHAVCYRDSKGLSVMYQLMQKTT